MLSIVVIILILLTGLALAAIPSNNKWRIAIILFSTVFLMTECVSIIFSTGFIDYQFYVNIDFNNIFLSVWFFKEETAIVFVIFVIACYVLYRLAKMIHQYVARKYLMIAGLFFIAGLSYSDGPLSSLYEIYQVTHISETDINRALKNFNIAPHDYPLKNAITAEKGKNIIVLSLESFEQNFMSSAFNDLTPNLKKLTRQYTYFDKIQVGRGSSWTVASMYTYMTGMPMLFGGYQTNPFKGKTNIKVANLGSILQQAGYQTRYVVGMPNFAGMGDAARLFDIPVVSETTYPNRYAEAPFGLYDRDAFDLAKHELNQMFQVDKPFALFLSTVSTHAPIGFADKRMESFVKKQKNDFEFAVASLDYNLGQFMDYLNEKGVLDNTVFYIFPDHTVMGAYTDIINKLSQQQPRRLYMITNAMPEELNKSPAENIYQIDLPRLILDGARVKTNAKFLTDFIDNTTNKLDFINKHKEEIAAFNSAATAE